MSRRGLRRRCRLHRLLAELTPGGLRRELSAGKAAAVLAGIRPRDVAGKVRRQLAAGHLADIRVLDRKMAAIRAQIAGMVEDNGTGLGQPFGIGAVIAGRLIAEVAGIRRFPPRTTSLPATRPRRWTCPPASRSATGCPAQGTAASTTPST